MSATQARPSPLAAAARFVSSLSSRDFRWLWANNVVGSLGGGTEWLAQGWLVLIMTDSPFWVGLVSGLRGVGMVAASPLGGILADRVNRRNALVAIYGLQGLMTAALGLLLVADQATLWQVALVTLLQGVALGLAVPVNNALIYDSVGRTLLLNAMAARNVAFNITRIFGGVLAGSIIAGLGVGACYLFAGGTLVISVGTLLPVKVGQPAAYVRESLWRNLVGGLGYVSRTRSLRILLILSVLIETFIFSHMILLPVVARDVLHVGAEGLGLLSSAGGVGAIVGTVLIAGLGDFQGKGRLLLVSCAGAGVALLFFALSPLFALSLVLVALVNVALWAYDSTLGALLQLLSAEAMRGRVLGLYGLTWGFTSVGGFVVGTIASVAGAPLALGVGAMATLAYLAGIIRPLVRLREAPEPVPGAAAEQTPAGGVAR